MLTRTRLLAVIALTAAVLLGYTAATVKFSPAPKADAAAPGGEAGAPQAGGGEEVISFTVFLPAEALLEIDGNKTTETGEQRLFQTPPLPVERRYHYTLKAT